MVFVEYINLGRYQLDFIIFWPSNSELPIPTINQLHINQMEPIFSHRPITSNLWDSLLQEIPDIHQKQQIQMINREDSNLIGDSSSKAAIDTDNFKAINRLGKMASQSGQIGELLIPNECLGLNSFIDLPGDKEKESMPLTSPLRHQNKRVLPSIPGQLDNQVSVCQTQLRASSADVFDLFEQKNLKRQWKKNTNIPKFLVRIYLKHFPTLNCSKTPKILQHYKRVKRQLTNRETNDYKIKDIQRLFETQGRPDQMVSANNRQVMSKIIRMQASQEINRNNYIRANQLSYMFAMKVYNLRCRSRILTERVKVF